MATEYKVKLVTLVEGEPKALFSIGTTAWCREGRNSILLNTFPIKNKKALQTDVACFTILVLGEPEVFQYIYIYIYIYI